MRPVVIHGLDHARAAIAAAAELGMPVTVQSAPGAGAYAGIGWFERVVALARAEYPDAAVTAVLHCGDAPGAVLEAVRWLKEPGRVKIVLCFTGEADAAGRLGEICRAAGIELVRTVDPGLDLRTAADPRAACRAWLAETAHAALRSAGGAEADESSLVAA